MKLWQNDADDSGAEWAAESLGLGRLRTAFLKGRYINSIARVTVVSFLLRIFQLQFSADLSGIDKHCGADRPSDGLLADSPLRIVPPAPSTRSQPHPHPATLPRLAVDPTPVAAAALPLRHRQHRPDR